MQYVYEHDQLLVLREKREHRKARGMAQNTDNHRGAPTERLESRSQNEHGENFCDLSNAHHRHDPVPGDADASQKPACPVEKQIVDRGVNEGDHP